jgi:hypothetical protein
MSLVERVRATGTCPPSLLKQEEAAEGDKSFEEVALKILDANGTCVATLCVFLMFPWNMPVNLSTFPSPDPHNQPGLSIAPSGDHLENFKTLLQVG